jgi:hypothetical protein
MRKRRIFCLMASCMLFGAREFASEAAPFAGQCIDGKLYVEPGTVHVAPNGIFLNQEGSFVPVSAVCVDDYGIYVSGYNAVRMVRCPTCGNAYDADNQSSECRNGYHPWKCQRQS